jgi:Pentapeptide repeats (8 copies)
VPKLSRCRDPGPTHRVVILLFDPMNGDRAIFGGCAPKGGDHEFANSARSNGQGSGSSATYSNGHRSYCAPYQPRQAAKGTVAARLQVGKRANLTGAALYVANLSTAHLIDAKLGIANLIGADRSRAKLDNAELLRADLRAANLNLAGGLTSSRQTSRLYRCFPRRPNNTSAVPTLLVAPQPFPAARQPPGRNPVRRKCERRVTSWTLSPP